jgi:HEAT repeat protein
LDDLRRKLLDSTVADKDKLQALRALRKNKALSDDVLQSALSWLQSSQDGALRRDILQQLGGVTNAALRQPLLDLAATSTDPKLRQQAVENLRDFVADADVEKRLWEMMATDPDGKVREQAEEALRKGPLTPERMASLQQRAANPQAPIEERITAMRALQKGGVDVSDTAMAMAQLAQTTQDVVARARIFQALDGVRDPRLLAPLVGGLQDPSPDVRKEATEALRRFASDPNIHQWLEYVAQSDADSRVKHEAYQALKKFREGPR